MLLIYGLIYSISMAVDKQSKTPVDKHAKPNNVLMNFSAGIAGGFIDSIFTISFDAMKTQMQKDPKMASLGIRRVFSDIMAKEGIGGFYRGFVPFSIMAAGKAGVRWGSTSALQKTADKIGVDRKNNKAFWDATCGFGAGIIEGIIWTAPAERLKVLRQTSTKFGETPLSYPQWFCQHGSIRGLWVGTTPTVLRSATNASIRLAIAGQVQEVFRFLSDTPMGTPLPVHYNMLAGGTGGAISTLFNNPFDVLKTQIQAGYKGGMISCARVFVTERGVVALLTSGLSARVPQIFVSQAIQFAVIQSFKERFGN